MTEVNKETELTKTTETKDGQFNKDLAAKYNEIFAETGKKKQDEAYLPPDENEEEIKETEEEKEEETEEVEETKETKEDDYEDIPERLVLAGRSAGFTDDKIIKLAEDSPEVLEAMANFRDQLVAKTTPQELVKSVVKPPEPEKIEPVKADLSSIEDEPTRKLVETLLAGQNQLIDKFNKTSVELGDLRSKGDTAEQRQQADFNLFVDKVFDEESKNYAHLGNSDALTPESKAVRSEVFEMALVFNRTRNKPIEQSLRDAVKAYNGLYGSTEAKAEEVLRQKLNAQKKRLTARPGGKRTERQYKNADEKAMEAMVEKGREIGLDW